MNARRLNMFHNAHNVEVFPVADRIYFSLLTAIEKMINQNFIARNMLQQTDHRFFYFLIVNNNSHSLSAQNITRPNKNGVTNFVGYLNRFINSKSSPVGGVRYMKVFKHVAESATIFSNIHI